MTFNPADFLDDEHNIIDNQTISEINSPHNYHLLISGWSTDVDRQVTSNYPEEKETLFRLHDGYLICLDLSLDDLFVNDEHTECNVEKLKEDLEACLEYFHYDINVVLAYTVEITEIQNNYDYQKRVKTKNDLKEVINILRKRMQELRKNSTHIKPIKSNYLFEEIKKYGLAPGIEKAHENVSVNGNSEIEKEAINTLNKLKEEFNNIKFDFPDGVLTAFSQLYYHPEHSFQLPILLRFKELCHAELWNSKDWSSEIIKDDTILNTPVLGYYTRDDEDGCKGPHIVLCPRNIEAKVSNRVDIGLMYKIVLIHELAHAQMDKNHVALKSIFSRAMEESLANMITLQWFKEFDHSNYDRVVSFIETQPEIYKFGINQFNAGVDWTKWRDSYKNMHDLLKDWFNSCFENPKLTNPNDVHDAYNRVFDNSESQNGNTGLIF